VVSVNEHLEKVVSSEVSDVETTVTERIPDADRA
jgi:hypothetical protein